jgi:alcohol dehydrogenase class IV
LIQKEYIGVGAIELLESILLEYPAKKVFLVTGSNSYVISGAQKYLDKILVGYKVNRFSDFSCNPKIEDVNKGIEAMKCAQSDTVIAVGGGSVIDMAKLINFFAAGDMQPLEYLKTSKRKTRKPKPLIAIPTTAGSGSEATHFAVLYIDKKKFSVDNKFLLPDVAVIDPSLTISLPKYLTAATGMDALSQAIESYWNINSNYECKKFAKSAIELIIANLVIVVKKPTDNARLAMAKAAHFAGKAINITKTTAPHALSYPLTSYFGIPHGHAVGLTLSSIFEYNLGVNSSDVLDTRGCEYVQRTLSQIAAFVGSTSVTDTKGKLDELMCQIGLETKLSRLGLKSKEDIRMVVNNAFEPTRVNNNPRLLTHTALRRMLYTIY